ncbi:MAG: hypothetical protein A2234_08690 [Elusimicrobia bacterium RIFOXYA2_FULL_58_8]|nr:MAG: hypothetical protein A2285_00065 [Elusimicrobia bacterium RIFOXYA12_FULL_57_11]OGS16730.1 MAG: hypothetical protein A2234_08690 [Elusimicrobia bacterium RIFOXYA2_FULL_58_8]
MLKNHKPALLVGVDEAGRGPLAGPVTACAAWVPVSAHKIISPLVDDSKKLSPLKRQRALKLMLESGVRFGFGFALAPEIDRVNILEATFNAMGAAVRRLLFYINTAPGGALLLVDGPYPVKRVEGCAQLPVIDGDSKSISIAAASIFAKVLRDRWLDVLELRHPGYGFTGHKGYGTAAHLAALNRLGPCPQHRATFAPVRKILASGARL